MINKILFSSLYILLVISGSSQDANKNLNNNSDSYYNHVENNYGGGYIKRSQNKGMLLKHSFQKIFFQKFSSVLEIHYIYLF